jgi:transposase
MDTREQRGIALAKAKALKQKGALWVVPSQSGASTYVVEPNGQLPNCTCPDYETRGIKCKHLYAVEYTVRHSVNSNGETTVEQTMRVTYRQNWAAYNAAQTVEKERVAGLLHGLCSAIDNPVNKNGRPRLPLSDAIFCAVMKVYGGTSGRRAMVDMQEYAESGYIDKAPHFNSILSILDNPEVTPILNALIEESARPLQQIETDFAVDSSGFSSCIYDRWFSHKYGRELSRSQWVKAHVMIGTTTNVVTSVRVTGSRSADSPQLPALLNATGKRFAVKTLAADRAYISHDNLDAIDAAGAFPLIPFKSHHNPTGARQTRDGKRRYSPESRALWQRMFNFFTYNREEFLKHYHQRSNVEATFSMIKAKFGSRVRAKTPTAQVNEVLAKVLCHNLCCLVSAIFELGIDAKFWHIESVA